MIPFKQAIKDRILRIIRPYPNSLWPKNMPPRGRALISYLDYPFWLPDDSPAFNGHTNTWECREIGRIFTEMGFAVDAIKWSDFSFKPQKPYDVVFDVAYNLCRLSANAGERTLKLLHCTGSNPEYQNKAERTRVAAMLSRRKGRYSMKRLVADLDLNYKCMKTADRISLIGNEFTLSTYPEDIQSKIKLLNVSASPLDRRVLNRVGESISTKRSFLWFFGMGAVLKGLDLVLEVFSRHPELTLHVVGPAKDEKDFVKLYRREMKQMAHIHCHGSLIPNSPAFLKILDECFCFIAPASSEGISPAVVTCMQAGLYPIVSRNTGVTLPSGCGIYLESCSIEEIERAVLSSIAMSPKELIAQVQATQAHALRQYSRSAFRESMRCYLAEVLKGIG